MNKELFVYRNQAARAVIAFAAFLLASPLYAKDKISVSTKFVSDYYSVAVTGRHPQQRYFYFPPKQKTKYAGVLLVLPGGRGNEDSRPHYGGVYLHALPDDYALVQLVNPIWREGQRIMWPTDKLTTPGMAFSTPKFVDAVLQDLRKLLKLDPNRVFILGRSSGGGAAYYAALENPRIRGAIIMASVFREALLPSLSMGKSKRFYLYQSPTDKITAYHYAQTAQSALQQAGAQVKLQPYDGGHYEKHPAGIYRAVHNALLWMENGHLPSQPSGQIPRFRR